METVVCYDSDDTVIDEEYSPDDWRNGPAKRWYDMLGLSPDCQQYDYGFQLKPEDESSSSAQKKQIDSEDAFNLVSQISWEKNIIWDSDSVRQRVMKTVAKPSIAGWIPIEEKRTAPQFFKPIDDDVIEKLISMDVFPKELINNCNENSKCDNQSKKTTKINGLSRSLRKRKAKFCDNDCANTTKKSVQVENVKDVFKWVSNLYEENRELVQNCWEDDIIWDTEAMSRIPEPKIIPFSSDDENVLIDWNDFDDNSNNSSHNSMAENLRQLSLNISNDEFYTSVIKADNSVTHSLVITHSVPAIKLHPFCFPTWDPLFFQPTLKRSRKLMPRVEYDVFLCNKQNSGLPSEAQVSKDLSKYLIKNICELSARSGQIILMEYSEESPPFVMRVGMGSKLLNYFNKTKDKNYCPEEHRFAETRAVTSSPFIGEIVAGKSQLALENNMFRSPIWEHTCPDTDFLVIITDENYFIREIDGLFVVGQTLPLMEAPRLKAKSYFDFAKQFAKMFIYRFFNGRKSVKNLEKELQKAIPNLSKHFLTNVLRRFTVRNNDHFRLKSEIPFDNQINDLLTPENCCAYYSSTITAATTLKSLGIGDRLYLNDEDNDCDKRLDELWFAPWNTTSAYIASLNARKLLNVNDYNEDGSLIFKNQSYKEFKDQMPSIRRCQPLTDLSIKRLTLRRAHDWLIDYGMSRQKVRRYKNVVECRELIKDLSDSLRESGVTSKMSKTRTTEQYYKLQCQKVFDLHSRFYSKQNYETDESEDEEEEEESDSDLEEWGADLEQMLLENKSLEQIEYEREQKELKELIKTVKGQKEPKADETKTKRSFKGKVLKICRTYERDGKKFVRDEIVRIPKVIEAYVRIRENKSEEFIQGLSFVKNHTESGLNSSKTKPKNKSVISVNKPPETANTANGVLKTVSENVSNIRNGFVNNCVKDSENIDINDDNWDIIDSTIEENESLVRVDGSKLKFSKKVVLDANQIEAEEQKRIREEEEEEERSKVVTYFRNLTSKRVRVDPMVKLKDIFDGVILEVRKRQELDENIEWFIEPIKVKDVPDYYDVIQNPMDLRTIRQNINRGRYSSREEFLKDVKQIYDNCLEYNGENDITADAHKLFQFCKEKLDSMEECIAPLESMYRTMFQKF